MKALTEKVYWVPGTRSDSTIVVELSVVLMLKITGRRPGKTRNCTSYNRIMPLGIWGWVQIRVMLSLRTPPGGKVRLRGAEGAEEIRIWGR